MTKLIVYLTKAIVAFLVATLFGSCQYSVNLGESIKGSGNVVTENRPVSGDFTNIEVSKGIELEVTQSDVKSIEVKADDNIIEHITTDIENGTLIISMDKNVKTSKTRTVFVTLPKIESLVSSSGAEIESKNTLVSQSLNVKASSGSEIKLTVEAEKINCESSSGSDIEVKGKALQLEAKSSSGSDIETKELLTNEVTAESSSGSSIKVHPIVSLAAKASSGSEVKFYNTPKTLTKTVSSGGSVRSN